MKRVPFSQVLKNAEIDIYREYNRLYDLFCLQKVKFGTRVTTTLKDFCAFSFLKFPLRGTCISLEDFDDSHGYHFEEDPSDFNLDYLVSFCEYSYNLVYSIEKYNCEMITMGLNSAIQAYIHQVRNVIENIGYMANIQNGILDFVPKDQAAISVAEIVDSNLSYKVIEYNHHSMKGDLEKKKATLFAFADKLEPQRENLNKANSSLTSDLFFFFNNMNIRHNNTDSKGKNYIPFVANMKEKEIEQWYDNIYQMCLLAFLELDHLDRKNNIKQLKQDIQKK